MDKRKIIIDCDPGHDDIMAILTALAHSQELEILGFCTVAGNQTLDKVTANLLKVEDYLGLDIPIYRGAEMPLERLGVPQPAAHGESGMDGPVLPDPVRSPQPLSALEFYHQTLQRHGEVTIVALAPLTNLGQLLLRYPEDGNRIEQIALMGGALNGGNINRYAEFNIWHDPEAAKIVFDSGIPVIMAPLEVCYAGGIMLAEVSRFANERRVSKLVYDLLDFYCGYARKRNWDSTAIFDLIPVIWLLKPELFVSRRGRVEIVLDGQDTQGQTLFTPGEGNHLVLTDTVREECIAVFFDAVDRLDSQYN